MFIFLSFLACADNSVNDNARDGAEESDISLNVGSSPRDWRPRNTVELDCPWISQQPTEDASTLNCGPTSLVMAAACVNQTIPTYDDVIDTITWMDENVETYDGSGEDNNGSSTNTVELEEVGNEYFDIPSERFYHILTLQSLNEDLESGVPVLVAVDAQGDNATDVMEGGGGHFVLLVGMTPTHVIVHDPGPYSASLGEGHEYTIDSFLDTWQNAGVRFFVE